MSFKCKCGGNRFKEIYTIHVRIVDGNGNFVEEDVTDIDHYECVDCNCEIDYGDFWEKAAVAAPKKKPKRKRS